jgi:hypothetical protein
MKMSSSSLSISLPMSKVTTMRTAFLRPLLLAAVGLGSALHAANADNPAIEIAGALDTPNAAICLNTVKPITANLQWPVTFTGHPVAGRYTWESVPGLQIDASQGGSFSKPPGTVEVENTSDSCTIYMKGTVSGTYDLKVKWASNDGRFNMPTDTGKILINPFMSATAKVLALSWPDIVPLPFNRAYVVSSQNRTTVSKCPGITYLQFKVTYIIGMTPEGGGATYATDHHLDASSDNFEETTPFLPGIVINRVSGPHEVKGLARVAVTFVEPVSAGPFPSIEDTKTQPVEVERLLPVR